MEEETISPDSGEEGEEVRPGQPRVEYGSAVESQQRRGFEQESSGACENPSVCGYKRQTDYPTIINAITLYRKDHTNE
ncbi:hypothetical protein CTA1_5345 [Colletotrichum tanaceti]|uniref:Uncharacterized protein n=1 Tax=Colletotrichum tanaceti TaxID=1306861 RepID=A0A4U6XGT5_9PEZI|nr:hypothetical protein CTA1_5345 [Colletotrichum tanaceti]